MLLTENSKPNLPWHEVESQIIKEIQWLKNAIVEFSSEGYKKSDEASYRHIATMIVQGKIKATEIRGKDLYTLWEALPDNQNLSKHKHGKDWHRTMMDIIDNFFSKQGYDVVTEPHLNSGRADLGVFMTGKMDLYVEVGTTSVDKLSVNIRSMPNCVFILVPEENRIVELVT